MQLLAADTVSKSLVEAVPPQLLPLTAEQGRTSGASKEKKKKTRKGKGKEKAVDQDGEVGGEDEDEGMDAETGALEEDDELLDPSTLVARALGSAGGQGVGPEDGIRIAGSGRTAVK